MRHSTYGNAYSRQQMKKDPTLSLPQPDEVNFPSGNIRKPPQIQPVTRAGYAGSAAAVRTDPRCGGKRKSSALVYAAGWHWPRPEQPVPRFLPRPFLRKVTGAFPSRLSTESALIRRPDAATAEFLPAQEEKFSSVRSSQAARLSSRTLSPGKRPKLSDRRQSFW